MRLREKWKLIIYYDGWCPMCTGIQKRVAAWDWLHLIEMVSFRDWDKVMPLPVPYSVLETKMHAVVPATGRVWRGIDAVAALSVRVPVLMTLWPVLKLSSWLGIGALVYDWIAARRQIVPVGHCNEGACSIHPAGSIAGDLSRGSQSGDAPSGGFHSSGCNSKRSD